MSKQVLEQTVSLDYLRQIRFTVYNDGSITVVGARQVNVINPANSMQGEIPDLAPDSSIAVIVRCTPDSIEAEMVRSNAPWMGMHVVPKISAHFFSASDGTIRFHCSPVPPPVPIAPPKEMAA